MRSQVTAMASERELEQARALYHSLGLPPTGARIPGRIDKIAAALARCREDAIKEAARVCDDAALEYVDGDSSLFAQDDAAWALMQACGKIRALVGKGKL